MRERDLKYMKTLASLWDSGTTGQSGNGRNISIVGENMDIDILSTPEDVISVGGTAYLPSAVATTTVVSSSDEDKSGGTGAFELYYEGMTTDFVPVSGVVSLNGITPVAMPDLLRCNLAFEGECGTNGTNVGTIDIKHGANVLAEIQAGHGTTQNAVFTVPAGYVGFITGFRISASVDIDKVNTNELIDAHLLLRSNVAPVTGWLTVRDEIVQQGNSYDDHYITGWNVKAGDDILIRVFVATADNMRVSGGFNLQLFKTG